MLEYLYNMIRATAGENADVCAVIEDDSGTPVTEGCGLCVFENTDDTIICDIDGVYADGMWTFTIPAEITEGLKGKYWYCFSQNERTLCFKQPIYFVG